MTCPSRFGWSRNCVSEVSDHAALIAYTPGYPEPSPECDDDDDYLQPVLCLRPILLK